jgi:hypothetical protein
MAPTSRANLLNFYKIRYPQRQLSNLAFAPTQFFNALAKEGNAGGEGWYHVWKHDSAGGTATTLTDAQANAYYSRGVRIQLDTKDLYTVVNIEDKALYQSKGKENAWMSQRESEMEAALASHGQVLARQAWLDGTGYIGIVGSGTASPITLADPQDSVNFHIGASIVFSEAAQNATARTGTAVVTKVDYDTGVITYSGTITALAVGDYAFLQSTYDSSTTFKCMTGVAGYIPLTAPSSGESFFGADRSVNPTNLAGHRQTYLGSIEETVKRLDSKMRRRNRNSTQACWLSFQNMHKLEMELGGRVTRDDGKDAVFGLPGFMLATPSGRIKFMGDSFMLEDRGFILDMSTWKVQHLEGLPHIVQTDGSTAVRGATTDSIEIRIRSWAQMLCTEPSRNGTFNID